MEVFVKESLHVLDYDNNIVDTIFLSDDRRTPGYAYDINITEANTGYSNLEFSIPNWIINETGGKDKNPKLAKLKPLVKLRYHRQVFYTGENEIVVREPSGYGDAITYIDVTYKNTYPDNIIEDYTMDYIVQPVDKKRNKLEISTRFTAIDYPRFNLSKKKVGLTITQDTLTREEWSRYENKPMDVPGTIKYEKWDDRFAKYSTITEWDPKNANEYPLTREDISNLIKNTKDWSYGYLGTAFYWPIVSTARFEGTMYTENGYLVLQLYDFYSLSDAGISPEQHIESWGWEWSYLREVDNYLTPNTADNYLFHILEDTNWKVKMRSDGKPDVDIVEKEVMNPDGATDPKSTVPHTCNLSLNNSNCYNAITELCKKLQLYPIFDCEKREVSLRAFAGKNYGLTYRLGSNINSDSVKNDGEKIITKLYVSGGKDYNGSENINIGEANRAFFDTGNPDEVEEPLWNPNDPRYIIKRSPYGTNYILNFKWMYDNHWIEKKDILDIYRVNQEINDLNKGFMKPYTEDRMNTLQRYTDAMNEYDLKQSTYQSILHSMMGKYYYNSGAASQGMFYAFHRAPLGTYKKEDGKNYIWIGHCKKDGCRKAWSSSTEPTQCTCGNTDIDAIELYIPVYADFPDVVPPNKPKYPYGDNVPEPKAAYEPYLKGDYLKLLSTLDNANADWDIHQYESKISIIEPIIYKQGALDGFTYELDGVTVRASSANIEEWNEDIEGFVTAYGEMLDALEMVEGCQKRLEELEKEYDNWKTQYDDKHAYIQKHYGDYIVEGNYTNNEQPYVGLLFKEGMDASDKYCIPEVTYTLDVVDSSGLIEYRQPTITKHYCPVCQYATEQYIESCPKCGHDKIHAAQDTYNSLVHQLHSVGQIVPKAGDYATIYDEPMGMLGVPALITEIKRVIDNPKNNKIQLNTSYTDDEELVGNIINATNTVLNNADIYARTAVLRADGSIDPSAITQVTTNPNANISIVGTDGNMMLNNSYLRLTDPNDDTKAMKYAGNGIFSTTTFAENEEGTLWETMMTPNGINATYINAGAIDTSHISIMSGLTSKILLDEYGLSVKRDANKSAHITTFNAQSATEDSTYADTWGKNNNLTAFIGVDQEKNPLIYTKGFLVAENGSNIANWITSEKGFYHLNGSNPDLWLSPSGKKPLSTGEGKAEVNGTSENFAIYANGNFGVTIGGKLYAKDANIEGTIVSSNVTITGGTLNIGSGFDVTNTGVLTASGAVVTGTITAESGTIGGWKIGSVTQNGVKKSYLGAHNATESTVGGANSYYLSQDGIYTYCSMNGDNKDNFYLFFKDKFAVTTGGKLYARDASITGSISSSTISGGSISISMNDNSYYFNMGVSTSHPNASGLNIGWGGINFRGEKGINLSDDATTWEFSGGHLSSAANSYLNNYYTNGNTGQYIVQNAGSFHKVGYSSIGRSSTTGDVMALHGYGYDTALWAGNTNQYILCGADQSNVLRNQRTYIRTNEMHVHDGDSYVEAVEDDYIYVATSSSGSSFKRMRVVRGMLVD